MFWTLQVDILKYGMNYWLKVTTYNFWTETNKILNMGVNAFAENLGVKFYHDKLRINYWRLIKFDWWLPLCFLEWTFRQNVTPLRSLLSAGRITSRSDGHRLQHLNKVCQIHSTEKKREPLFQTKPFIGAKSCNNSKCFRWKLLEDKIDINVWA